MVALMGWGCCIFCVFVSSVCIAVPLLQRALCTNWGSLPVTSDDAQPSSHSLYELGQNLWQRRSDPASLCVQESIFKIGVCTLTRHTLPLWRVPEQQDAPGGHRFYCCTLVCCTCSRKNTKFPHLPYDCSLKSQISSNLWTLFHFCISVKACGPTGNGLWAGLWAAVVFAPQTRSFSCCSLSPIIISIWLQPLLANMAFPSHSLLLLSSLQVPPPLNWHRQSCNSNPVTMMAMWVGLTLQGSTARGHCWAWPPYFTQIFIDLLAH